MPTFKWQILPFSFTQYRLFFSDIWMYLQSLQQNPWWCFSASGLQDEMLMRILTEETRESLHRYYMHSFVHLSAWWCWRWWRYFEHEKHLCWNRPDFYIIPTIVLIQSWFRPLVLVTLLYTGQHLLLSVDHQWLVMSF